MKARCSSAPSVGHTGVLREAACSAIRAIIRATLTAGQAMRRQRSPVARDTPGDPYFLSCW